MPSRAKRLMNVLSSESRDKTCFSYAESRKTTNEIVCVASFLIARNYTENTQRDTEK
jgi:hypothetical protein